MSMEALPWYKTFFGEDYLQIYTFLTPERTEREVDGIVTLLNLPTGSSILDLCCGHGRHALALARRGYRLTGLDLSAVFLQRAQADAEHQGIQVRWVEGDMRKIPFENAFEAIINIFTAFGYLESEEEDQQVLQQVQRALKPGGLFLLETMHREWLVRNFAPGEIHRHPDGLMVLEERTFDLLAGRCDVQVTMLSPGGQRRQYTHSVRMYTLRELARMLAAAGLQIQASYGGLDGSRLSLNSPRLVVIGAKDEQGRSRG
jgi:ubiquinone/menaquinone biosynthesis C-methylase UbiE